MSRDAEDLDIEARQAIVDLGTIITEYDGAIPASPYAVHVFLAHLSTYEGTGDELREYIDALQQALASFVQAKREQVDARAEAGGVEWVRVNGGDLMSALSALVGGDDESEAPCDCAECVADRAAADEKRRAEAN